MVYTFSRILKHANYAKIYMAEISTLTVYILCGVFVVVSSFSWRGLSHVKLCNRAAASGHSAGMPKPARQAG